MVWHENNSCTLSTCVAWMTAGSPDTPGAVAYNGFSNVIGCLPASMAKLSSCGDIILMWLPFEFIQIHHELVSEPLLRRAVLEGMLKWNLSINTFACFESKMLTAQKILTANKHPCRTHHLHGCVNEWHSNVWWPEVNIIPRAKRHPIPRVTGLH